MIRILIRFLWVYLRAQFRPPVGVFGPSELVMRVWPSDIDFLFHMNNGVYFTLLDMARVDLVTRNGMGKKLSAEKWYAVVAGEAIEFKKSLNLLTMFKIETSVLGWDEKNFFIFHRFVAKGDVSAQALVRVRVLDRNNQPVNPHAVMDLIEPGMRSPEFPEWLGSWTQTQLRLRKL